MQICIAAGRLIGEACSVHLQECLFLALKHRLGLPDRRLPGQVHNDCCTKICSSLLIQQQPKRHNQKLISYVFLLRQLLVTVL
jgi:hypothetical protein